MRALIPFVFLLFLFSCSSKSKIPENVLSSEKMEQVFVDLIRADEFINQQGASSTSDSVKAKRIDLYQKVFKMHGVSRQQFQKSLTFYQSRPDLLKIVLDSMHSQVAASSKAVADSIKAQ